jgi:hypothetical protein
MNPYSYRLLTFEDLPGLNRLFKDAFEVDLKPEFFLWKYFSNPAGDTIIAGAFVGDQLVGSGAMMPEIMNVLGKEELVYKCTDLMTHPLHQKKGISKKVNELLNSAIQDKGVPFTYTLCTKISTKSFLRNGWTHVGGAINFFKPVMYLRIIGLFRKNKFPTLRFYNSVADYLDNYQFKDDRSLIGIKKTQEFLRWRTSNPNFISRMICSFNNQVINGYLIYSVSKTNFIHVVDLETSGDDEKIKKDLLNCIEHIAVQENYRAVIAMTIKGTLFYSFIKRNGYFHNPFKKGPLVSELDFDVHYYDNKINTGTGIDCWNLNALNYDDV